MTDRPRSVAKHFNTGIVGAAFRTRHGKVLTLPRPARHCHFRAAYNEHCRALGWDFPWAGWSTEELRGSQQGFVTHDGRFVHRDEARDIAIQEKQLDPSDGLGNLFSEDLW